MSWARYDDEFPMNRKVGELLALGRDGVAALGLHLLANTWCRHNGTAGVIPGAQTGLLVGDRKLGPILAGMLEQVGMFDPHPTGWAIHDYAEFHDPADPDPDRSAADRKKDLSEKRREAGRKGGQAKASKATVLPEALLQQTSSPDPVPTTTRTTTTHHRLHGGDDDDFAKTVTLIVDARCMGRIIGKPAGYRYKVARDVETTHGDWIRALLAQGEDPIDIAAWESGVDGTTPNDQPRAIAWCDASCPTCGGDAWIDTGAGLAPCPERTTQ